MSDDSLPWWATLHIRLRNGSGVQVFQAGAAEVDRGASVQSAFEAQLIMAKVLILSELILFAI